MGWGGGWGVVGGSLGIYFEGGGSLGCYFLSVEIKFLKFFCLGPQILISIPFVA